MYSSKKSSKRCWIIHKSNYRHRRFSLFHSQALDFIPKHSLNFQTFIHKELMNVNSNQFLLWPLMRYTSHRARSYLLRYKKPWTKSHASLWRARSYSLPGVSHGFHFSGIMAVPNAPEEHQIPNQEADKCQINLSDTNMKSGRNHRLVLNEFLMTPFEVLY